MRDEAATQNERHHHQHCSANGCEVSVLVDVDDALVTLACLRAWALGKSVVEEVKSCLVTSSTLHVVAVSDFQKKKANNA